MSDSDLKKKDNNVICSTVCEIKELLTQSRQNIAIQVNQELITTYWKCYPKFQTVSGKLSWSHYCELLSISDSDKRSFYEKECMNAGWSVRELKRQIESSLFERLLLSKGEINKEQVLLLATKGADYTSPSDVIKDPYVFEFGMNKIVYRVFR